MSAIFCCCDLLAFITFNIYRNVFTKTWSRPVVVTVIPRSCCVLVLLFSCRAWACSPTLCFDWGLLAGRLFYSTPDLCGLQHGWRTTTSSLAAGALSSSCLCCLCVSLDLSACALADACLFFVVQRRCSVGCAVSPPRSVCSSAPPPPPLRWLTFCPPCGCLETAALRLRTAACRVPSPTGECKYNTIP